MKIAGTPIRSVEGRVLLWMLILDMAFLGASLAYHYSDVFVDRRYSINGHGGFGEMYQYAKQFTCALLLVGAALRCRQVLPASWALLFLYILLTDAFRINAAIATQIGTSPLFETIFSNISDWHLRRAIVAAFGGLLVLIIVRAYRSSDSKTLREDSRGLAVLFFPYLCFGVFADYLTRLLSSMNKPAAQHLVVVEEWGEMLFMSLLVIGAYLFFVRCLRFHLPRTSVSIETSTRRQPLTRART